MDSSNSFLSRAAKRPFVQHVSNHLQKARLLFVRQLPSTASQSYPDASEQQQELFDDSLLAPRLQHDTAKTANAEKQQTFVEIRISMKDRVELQVAAYVRRVSKAPLLSATRDFYRCLATLALM